MANTGALAVTDAECEALTPEPVHCNEYEIVPAAAGVTFCEPSVATVPVQSLSVGVAEATQEVACVLDQVSVVACPTVTVVGEAEMVTVGNGGGGGWLLPPQAWNRQRLPTTTTSSTPCFMTPPHAQKSYSQRCEPGQGRIMGSLFGGNQRGRRDTKNGGHNTPARIPHTSTKMHRSWTEPTLSRSLRLLDRTSHSQRSEWVV